MHGLTSMQFRTNLHVVPVTLSITGELVVESMMLFHQPSDEQQSTHTVLQNRKQNREVTQSANVLYTLSTLVILCDRPGDSNSLERSYLLSVFGSL